MSLHDPMSDFNELASPAQTLRYLKTGCKILAAARASMAKLEIPENMRPASVRSGKNPILTEIHRQRRALRLNEGAGYVAASLGSACSLLFQGIPELLSPSLVMAALGAMALRDTMQEERNLLHFTQLAEDGGTKAVERELQWTAQSVRNMANELNGYQAQKLQRQLRKISAHYKII